MGYLAIFMLVFLAVAGYSNAAYCVCNTAQSDSVLQKNIDYACGNGADCSQINPNGACFNPNTVKDHCNYAVNNYYQKKGQVQGSCDFSGTASPTQTLPSGVNSACFSGNSSPTTPTPPGTGTGTPPGTGTGTPPGTGTGTPPGTGIATPPPGTGTGTPGTGTGTGTPGTGTGTGTPGTGNGTGTGTPGTGTGTGTPGSGTGTGTGTGTGINVNPPFGMGPTTGFDNSGCMSIHKITNLFKLATLLVSGLIWSRLI